MIVTRWGARFRGRRFPCSIGRGGIRPDKREGDGATPEGVHRVAGALWRADRMKVPPCRARAIGPADLWSDDPRDANYNRLVRVPHLWGHERLRRADPQYDLVLFTDWNWPRAVPGKGSAIFLHVWRRPRWPTAGCVAFRKADLFWIARRMDGRTRVIVRGHGARNFQQNIDN